MKISQIIIFYLGLGIPIIFDVIYLVLDYPDALRNWCLASAIIFFALFGHTLAALFINTKNKIIYITDKIILFMMFLVDIAIMFIYFNDDNNYPVYVKNWFTIYITLRFIVWISIAIVLICKLIITVRPTISYEPGNAGDA